VDYLQRMETSLFAESTHSLWCWFHPAMFKEARHFLEEFTDGLNVDVR